MNFAGKVTLFLGLVWASCAVAKPNVLFILIDDFGWHDVGYNGSTFYETPSLDRFAREWMRFDACYTPSPMCSPTRASILTGKNPARHGITQWLAGRDAFYGKKGEKPAVYCPKPQSAGIQASEITLGEAFQEAGYETAFYGKWHMGKLRSTGGPKNHGYAKQRAIIEENGARMFYGGKNPYFPKAGPNRCFTDLLADAAISFIEEERGRPFYLHLCFYSMHAPIQAKPELRQRFLDKRQRLGLTDAETARDPYSHQPHKLTQDSCEYAGQLFNLDANVGRVVDALKASGQYEDTIIVLTGDNGGRATTNKPHATSVMPLRGGKTFLFEGGLRTPLLIHWPGVGKVGTSCAQPVTSMDFYPTLLEMTGQPLRPNQHVDGVSLVPLFREGEIRRDTLYWHFPHYQGEGSYPASAIRKGDYKLIHNYHQGDLLLFNLATDPYEQHNLATRSPERVAALDRELMTYLKDVGAYLPQPPTAAEAARAEAKRKVRPRKK
jgi:arylsulfatase A-like enzyme